MTIISKKQGENIISKFMSALFKKAVFEPMRITTTAAVQLGDAPTINLIELDTHAEVPNPTEAELQKCAEEAKKGCPFPGALAGLEIRMQAHRIK